jgi:hypothetical protein
MRVEIEIPPQDQIISGGCNVALARKGVTWSQTYLGKKANETGVYVIHHGEKIKYVGKTNGPSMSFGIRLRREFQESASGGRHIYPQLSALTVPPQIMVSLFTAAEINVLVQSSGMKLNDYEATEIFEMVLIHAYRPDFQRHQESRTAAFLKKLDITDDPTALLAMLKRRSDSS